MPDGRVLWRCRRGMRELDVLLERCLRQHYCGASPAQKAAFVRLLELPDPLLASYLLGGVTPDDPELAELMSWVKLPGSNPVTGVTPA